MPTIADVLRRYGGQYLERFSTTRCQGAQEGAARDHRVPHRRTGDRALRLPILRGDPRDRPIVRQPALPDLPAREDQGLAREADRPPAAVPLFLVTFTLPAELRAALARSHQRVMYAALFEASSQALRQLGREPESCGHRSPRLLRCSAYFKPALEYHPHVHYVVPGGGIDEGGNRWLPSRADFLVPVEALSILFRRQVPRHPGARRTCFTLVHPAAWQRDWVVHSRAAGDGRASLRIFAPYVFRVAIGNRRIVSCEDGNVTFTYRRVGSKRLRKMSLDAMEFLRRFLQHVLPAGFQKVRHYGFLSPNCATSIEAVRWMVTVHNQAKFVLLAKRTEEPAAQPVPRCPSCGGPMCPPGIRCRSWHHSIRANPMIDVNLFETCSRMASRCRSPLARYARRWFRVPLGGCSQGSSGHPEDLRRTPPQCSSYLSFALRTPLSAPLIAPSPIPPESVTHSQPAAGSPPGFLNLDWRSGFADSNP